EGGAAGEDMRAALADAGLTLAEVGGAEGLAAVPDEPRPAGGEREEEFRFEGGISEFCEHLSSGEPVTGVVRLGGSGRFTETIPVLDDQGHMTPSDVERELTVDGAPRWGTGHRTATPPVVHPLSPPHGRPPLA